MVRVFNQNTATPGADDTANKGKYCEDVGLDVNGDTAGTAGDGFCHADERTVDPFGFWTMGASHANYDSDPLNNPTNKVKATASKVKGRYQATKNTASVYEYGSAANFAKAVDNSIAGQLRDCAECHVGGGAMQYPIADRDNEYDNAVEGAGNYTAYSHFIDIYDEDGDGDKDEVLPANWNVSGVMEMDCLMCHMDGYSWSDRRAAIVDGQLAASAAVGAGLATASGTSQTSITMAYDANAVDGGAGANVTLNTATMAKIDGAPAPENCSGCHFDMHAVDWKKRGSAWSGDATHEVHTSIGCMGCHERTDNTEIMTALQSVNLEAWDGSGTSALLGHDPTKGNIVFSSLWNKTDTKDAKTCASCHTANPSVEAYGAADPASAHTAAGLTGNFITNGLDGVADASHLDVMHCDACHARKLGHGPTAAQGGDTHGSLYEWGTGAAWVDSTGPDHEGRLTVHDTRNIERTVEGNQIRTWDGSKIINASSLVTMFWRDKDQDADGTCSQVGGPYVDINADGCAGAMDPVLPTHIMGAMTDNSLHELTYDGNITDAKIDAQRAAIKDYLTNTAGINATNAKLKLSWMGVLFRSNHGIAPAASAWGAGGCSDCHGADAGFYNGDINTAPRDITVDFDASTQRTPFTKVNGKTQATDYHPMIHPKGHKGKRTIAVQVANAGTDAGFVKDRSVFLYEEDMTVLTRKGVDGTNYTTRSTFVDHLNGLPGSLDTQAGLNNKLHANHLNEATVTACTDCHSSAVVGYGDELNAGMSRSNCTTSCHDSVNGIDTGAEITAVANGLKWTVGNHTNRILIDGRYSSCLDTDADNVITDLGCTVTITPPAGCDAVAYDESSKASLYDCDSTGAKVFTVVVDNVNNGAGDANPVAVTTTATVTLN